MPAGKAKTALANRKFIKSIGIYRQNNEIMHGYAHAGQRTAAAKRPSSRITYILVCIILALYESLVMTRGAPQGNEIRASEDP